MPQVIMLNHAADANRRRLEKRSEARRALKNDTPKSDIVYNGKTFEELNSAEMVEYLNS